MPERSRKRFSPSCRGFCLAAVWRPCTARPTKARTARRRFSLGYPAPARRRSPPTPRGALSGTTNMAGPREDLQLRGGIVRQDDWSIRGRGARNFRAAQRFGAVLENVILDPATRSPRFDDDSRTENTRAAFPLEFLDPAAGGTGAHPSRVIFLSADAFGVLPPVARLTRDQALYWFLSGYTSKLAGTERGVTTPEATFSTCFGAPFLPLPPVRYAHLLASASTGTGQRSGWSTPAGQGGPSGPDPACRSR